MRRELRLKVVLDPSRRDCFATISSATVSTYLVPLYGGGPQAVPQVVPMRLEKQEEKSSTSPSARSTTQPPSPTTKGPPLVATTTTTTGKEGTTTGATSQQQFLGVLAHQCHPASKGPEDAVLMGPALLQAMNLNPDTFVTLHPLRSDSYRDALSVFVSPFSVDDSEIVEHNQRRIEDVLLRQLRVVYEGLVVTVPVHGGLSVRLKFGKVAYVQTQEGLTSPRWQCATLTQGTELYVSTKTRAQQKDPKDDAAKPLPAFLRLTKGMSTIGGSQGGGLEKKSKPASPTTPVVGSSPAPPPALVVSQNLAERYHWSEGLALGVLAASAITMDVLCANPHQRQQQQHKDPTSGDLLQPASAAEAEPYSVVASSSLRTAFRVVVRVQAQEVSETNNKDEASCPPSSLSCCYIEGMKGGDLLLQQGAYIFPHPPSQVQSATSLPASITSAVNEHLTPWTECAFHHEVMYAVYGKSFLSSQLGPLLFAQMQHRVKEACHTLLIGGRGSGKSTVSQWLATQVKKNYQGFVIGIDCRGRTADTTLMKEIKQIFYLAALNAPSLVVLDNLDAAFPADQEGNPNAPAVSKSAVTVLHDLIATASSVPFMLDDHTPRTSAPVVVLATVGSRETLHDYLRESPKTFSVLTKMPTLTLPAKKALLEKGLILTTEGQSDSSSTPNPTNNSNVPLSSSSTSILSAQCINNIALKLDNYAVHDVVQVCRRSLRAYHDGNNNITGCAKNGVTSAASAKQQQQDALREATLATVATYHPLAHQGINLLDKDNNKGAATTTWSGVGAMRDAKKEMYNSLVLPTKFPQLFATLPLKTRSGVLLYGPPGCGKTFVLQALVATHKLNCIVVNGPEILDKYIGASEQKVREVFERAQAAAPCILFFDEFDSIAPQRGHDNTGVTDRVVNQLLCYLDGVEARSSVYVVAASSRPDLIDAALLRPGRLDKAIYCKLPSQEERLDILRVHAAAIKLEPGVDLEHLAGNDLTENWTGADLAGLVSTVNVRVVNRQLEAKTAMTASAAAGSGPTTLAPTVGTDEDVAMFEVMSPGGASGDVKRKLLETIREAAPALKKQLAIDRPQQLSSSTKSVKRPSLQPGDNSSSSQHSVLATQGATMEDFLVGIQDTRPSIAPKELRMYTHIYNKFSNSREKKGTAKAASATEDVTEIPGSRTTMA